MGPKTGQLERERLETGNRKREGEREARERNAARTRHVRKGVRGTKASAKQIGSWAKYQSQPRVPNVKHDPAVTLTVLWNFRAQVRLFGGGRFCAEPMDAATQEGLALLKTFVSTPTHPQKHNPQQTPTWLM